MDFSWFTEALKTNEFMQGGLVVALFTSLLMYLRSVPPRLWDLFWYYTSTEVFFDQSDENFNYALGLLISKHIKSNFGSFFMVRGLKVPAGVRWYFTGGCLVSMALVKREVEMADYGGGVVYSVFIKVYGFNRQSVIRKINEDINSFKVQSLRIVSNFDMYDLPSRSFETIASSATKFIKEDLDLFIESEDWYKDRAIPYRRGYLFYGPPGTGKTTLALAIANYLKRDLTCVNLACTPPSDLRNHFAGKGKLILIEDVDVSNNSVKDRDSDLDGPVKAAQVTLSDILNAIDGVASGSNNILIMTTNDIDSLDKALIRPGRIDVCLEIGYMDQESFDYLLKRYFPDEQTFEVPEKITPAEVQSIYLINRDNFQGFKDELQRNRTERIG